MWESVKKYRIRSGSSTMTSMTLILKITSIALMLTLIDAQNESNDGSDKSQTDGAVIRSDPYLPPRMRRFWSIFDWPDSGEKRMSRFLPVRFGKSSFLPMRGKKYSQSNSLKVGNNYNNPFVGQTFRSGVPDDYDYNSDESLSLEKKAFHAMRGRK